MKYLNKFNKFTIALIIIILIIIIIITLFYKCNKKIEKFESTDTENYFSVDTINKIANSNLSIPTFEPNPFKMMHGTILPYYEDFTKENVISLVNNNYLPCWYSDELNTWISESTKDIGNITYAIMESDTTGRKSTAYYNININDKNIKVPDLRRMYLAGSDNGRDPDDNIFNDGKNDGYIKGSVIGKEKHLLTEKECALPEHNHTGTTKTDGINVGVTMEDYTYDYYTRRFKYSKKSGIPYYTHNDSKVYGYNHDYGTGFHSHDLTINNTNKNATSPHENRPPTVIVNYIMYVEELPNKVVSN